MDGSKEMRVLHGVGRRLPSMRVARLAGRWVLLPTMLVTLVAASTPGLATARGPDLDPRTSILGSMLNDLQPIPLDSLNTRSFVPALADPDRSVSVMVEMQGDSVAVAQANALE